MLLATVAALPAALAGCPAHAQMPMTAAAREGAAAPARTSPVAPNAPLPPVEIEAQQEQTSPGTQRFAAIGHVIIRGGSEFEIRADKITGSLSSGVGEASGHIFLRELDTSVTAEQLFYNQQRGVGVFQQAMLEFPPFMLAATEIQLRPGILDATHATFSTCPPGAKQDYHVQADRIRVHLIDRRVEVRNARLFIGRTQILRINKIGFKPTQSGAASNGNSSLRQTIGYDGHRGPYIVAGTNLAEGPVPISLTGLLPTKGPWSASAVTSTTIVLHSTKSDEQKQADAASHSSLIALIREFASQAGAPVPQGDPLLFHDFLGGNRLESVFARPVQSDIVPNATLSYREPIYGRRIGNLSYSRLPEIAARVDLPISGNANLPSDRDPVHVRQALRHLYVFAGATVAQGYYQEQPTGAKSSRTALQINLDTRPILLSRDVLFRPRVSFYNAVYSDEHDSYHYEQLDLAIQRNFSDRTAIGAEYIGTTQRGTDPFVFDSVDTGQELDLRGQAGGEHVIYGARLKIDLIHRHLFDTALLVGLPQKCFIPTITYERPSGTIGIGVNIPGITF